MFHVVKVNKQVNLIANKVTELSPDNLQIQRQGLKISLISSVKKGEI